jgi:hypothetical protein
MKSRFSFAALTIAAILFAMTIDPNTARSGHVPVKPVTALTGSAVLDDWGNRFTFLGTVVNENPLRTQVRTTIAQMAMFDAVNAALKGPYRFFASKPPAAAPGASPEVAAISAAYFVALNEFPSITQIVEDAYLRSLGTVSEWVRPQPRQCSTTAKTITGTCRIWMVTRQAVAQVCGSRHQPQTRIRRLHFFSS